MSKLSILIAGFTFFIIALIAIFVYFKWRQFKDLQIGDWCGKFDEYSNTKEMDTERIIRVDTDENGYARKIYTKRRSFTFFESIFHNIRTIYDD